MFPRLQLLSKSLAFSAMNSENPTRIRETVYVVGAGFSAGLGYPLTKNLLLDVRGRLGAKSYGLEDELGTGPVLLKPHGSLNWYRASHAESGIDKNMHDGVPIL